MITVLARHGLESVRVASSSTVGVAARISVLRLGAEVNMARVPGYSLKIGFGT